MQEYPELISRLQTLELVAYEFEHKGNKIINCGLEVERPKDLDQGVSYRERCGRVVGISDHPLLNRECFLIDPLMIFKHDDGWRVRNAIPMKFGGENLDSLNYLFPSTESLVKFCEDYFFQEALNISGWELPVFQLPGWNKQDVVKAIQFAQTIRLDSMLEIIRRNGALADERRRQMSSRVKTSETRDLYFGAIKDLVFYRTIEHTTERELFLRFDCKIAYIVDISSFNRKMDKHRKRAANS